MLEWWVPHNYIYNIIKKTKLKIVSSTKKSSFLAILTQNSVTNKQVKAQSTESTTNQCKEKKRWNYTLTEITRRALKGLPRWVHWRSFFPLFLEPSPSKGKFSDNTILIRCSREVDDAPLPGSGYKIITITRWITVYRSISWSHLSSLFLLGSTPLITSGSWAAIYGLRGSKNVRERERERELQGELSFAWWKGSWLVAWGLDLMEILSICCSKQIIK